MACLRLVLTHIQEYCVHDHMMSKDISSCLWNKHSQKAKPKLKGRTCGRAWISKPVFGSDKNMCLHMDIVLLALWQAWFCYHPLWASLDAYTGTIQLVVRCTEALRMSSHFFVLSSAFWSNLVKSTETFHSSGMRARRLGILPGSP